MDGASSIFGSVRVFSHVVQRMWNEQQVCVCVCLFFIFIIYSLLSHHLFPQAYLEMLTPEELRVLEQTTTILEESSQLARQHQLGCRNVNQLIAFVRKV